MANLNPALQAAAQRKYKGKYAGPDKYKGVIPKHLQHKYKGTYFGKEANKGSNPTNRMGASIGKFKAVRGGKKSPTIGTSSRFGSQGQIQKPLTGTFKSLPSGSGAVKQAPSDSASARQAVLDRLRLSQAQQKAASTVVGFR